MTLKTDDRVLVVEHDEATKTPREGGLRFPAKVDTIDGIYVRVDYDDKSLDMGLPCEFWVISPRRVLDSCRRWRLMTEEAR